MNSEATILSAIHVSRQFSAGRSKVVHALEDVSIDLRVGETLGIVGESGSGKSTLARILLALDRPTSGDVHLEGRDLFALRPKELRRARQSIQIIMQDPYTSLDPRHTAAEIVEEPFQIHRDIAPKDHKRAVAELFEMVGLNPDHLNRYPHQFSGGQRQRIGIARAIALKPRVVVCDEPVSALDVSVQAQVVNLLKSLQRELGLSYIFIAHDISVVEHMSDRIAVMYLGRVVETGGTEEICSRPTHPYTQALMSAAPTDPRSPGTRQQIVLQGEVPSPLAIPSGCPFRTRCWKATEICAQLVPGLETRPDSAHPSACHHASPDHRRGGI